jgi:hypothetical protein
MAEGKITFAVGVESSDAISGLKDVSAGMDKLGKASGEAADETVDALKKVEKATKDSGKSSTKSSKKATDQLKKSAKTQKHVANDQIKGLDGLKESTGEASSSMGALGGAIGVVNPQIGGMVSSAGALAGGMEGAAKGVKLLKGSVAGLLVTMGPMLIVLGSLAAATAIFTMRSRKQARQEEKLISLGKQRVAVMKGIVTSLQAARIADDLATGSITEYEAAIQSTTARREKDGVAIGELRKQVQGLSGDDKRAGEVEVAGMVKRADELAKLGRRRAFRSAEKIHNDKKEASSAEARSAREVAASEAEAEATEALSKVAEEKAEADAKAATDATNRAKAQDILAAATGQAAVIERNYAKAIMEANALRVAGALSEQELADVMAGSFADRTAQIDAINAAEQAAHDADLLRIQEGVDKEKAANAEKFQGQMDAAQNRIGQVAEFNNAIGGLVNAASAKIAQDIDQEEAAALARAEGNLEEQEKIKQRFNKRRASEMAGAFKVQQAVEIASVAMSGASAAIGALAPPPTGLGIALGTIAAPIIAATTAAQIAVIASQSAPSFHQGGVVGGQGNQSITAQGGEVMLNRGAVAAMGGTAAANSLNSGGGGGGSIVVQMVYKQRVLDQLVVDNLAKGGPLKTALNNATRTGRRGRVGGLL